MVNDSTSATHAASVRPIRTTRTQPGQSGVNAAATSLFSPPAWLVLVASLPARALLGLVWLYQRTLSPVLPIVLGPTCGCRFAPTCSHYAAEAVRVHGAVWGSLLAARRLLKCTPLHPGGLDPVPPRHAKPACHRSSPRATTLSAPDTIHRSSSRFGLTA